MISRRACLALPLLLAAAPAGAHHVQFEVLRPGDFAARVAARSGKAFLLVLWSLACEPCRPDLELLRELRSRHPAMPLALLSTDGVALQEAAGKVLLAHGLEHEANWIMVNRNNRALREEIDPAWGGAVPRAYFYDASGRREALAGPLDRRRLEAWLASLDPAA